MQKSKRALFRAIQELLEEKEFDKITVQMILDRAEVSKSTFYNHFLDKYDLMNQFFSRYIDSLLRKGEKGETYKRAEDTLYFIYEHRVFFKHALKTHGDNNFFDYMAKYYCEKYIEFFTCDKGSVSDIDLTAIIFYSYGVAYVIKDWVINDCKMSIAVLTEQIRSYIPPQIPPHY